MSKNENDYPLMVFLDGDVEKAHTIVNDAEEEKIAKADGFIRIGAKPAPSKSDKP